MVDQAFYTLPQLHAALRGEGGISADLDGMQAIADRFAAGEEVFYAASVAVEEPAAEQETVLDTLDALVPEETMPVETAVAPAETEADDGVTANVDPVLLEILDVEIGGHLATVDQWIFAARTAPASADDGLLRAIHTMNGAFAMTEVPAITDAMTPAEAYVKRLLVAHAIATPDGIDALAQLADAARATVAALHASTPRVPRCDALAARLAALRDSLPEGTLPFEEIAAAEPVFEPVHADDPLAQELAALDLSAYGDLAAEFDGDSDAAVEPVPIEHLSFEDDAVGELGGMPHAESENGGADLAGIDFAEPQRAADEPVDGDRLDAERRELDRLESARLEAERIEAERLEAERTEAARLEEEERLEYARLEAEYAEQDRLARAQAETERQESERLEHARLENERAEAARNESERAETARLDAERAEAARLQAERAAAEQAEAERQEAERVAAEQAEAERLEAERVAAEQAEAERLAAEATEATAGAQAPAAPEPVFAAFLGQAASSAEDPDEALDLTDLDPELVDIFVEESVDLLDHSDSLLAQLREAPGEREPLVGLQRNLHTLKGGARMAGIMAAGELGHVMESLLEAVVDQRTELGRDGIPLLERGIDRLHAMITRVGTRRAIGLPEQLIAEFDARSRGEAFAPAQRAVGDRAKPVPMPAPKVELKPLSAPIGDDAHGEDDDVSVRAPQEHMLRQAVDHDLE
jgi:chemosensory pili system protein ChpA (sensor histidine kinase/response regulator)